MTYENRYRIINRSLTANKTLIVLYIFQAYQRLMINLCECEKSMHIRY